jgi:hypothetical protein
MVCAFYGSEIDTLHKCSNQTFDTTLHHGTYNKEAQEMAPKMRNTSLVILKFSGMHATNIALLLTVVCPSATPVEISSNAKT